MRSRGSRWRSAVICGHARLHRIGSWADFVNGNDANQLLKVVTMMM